MQRCRAWSTSRSTTRSTWPRGRSAPRTWRSASARRCQVCQVDRCSSTVATICCAVAATQAAVTAGAGTCRRLQDGVEHAAELLLAAEHVDGFGVPGGALLGEAAGFVLRVPGLQGGLLRQLQRLHRRGWPAVVLLEPGGQLTLPDHDHLPPRRPPLVQRRVDADDLPHRPLPRVRVGSFGEADAEPVGEVVFEGGVVGLRRRHLRLEQHPAVDRQPLPGQGLHLVRHRHMGVQVRVAGAAVPVRERRRDQTADVDLPHPTLALSGEQGVLLEEPQRVRHRRLVGLLDQSGGLRVGDRPQALTPT